MTKAVPEPTTIAVAQGVVLETTIDPQIKRLALWSGYDQSPLLLTNVLELGHCTKEIDGHFRCCIIW
jgi:hypothetical protein